MFTGYFAGSRLNAAKHNFSTFGKFLSNFSPGNPLVLHGKLLTLNAVKMMQQLHFQVKRRSIFNYEHQNDHEKNIAVHFVHFGVFNRTFSLKQQLEFENCIDLYDLIRFRIYTNWVR